MQPPKTHFLTFSKVQKHIMEKKSETKIMKITHSAATCLTYKNGKSKGKIEEQSEIISSLGTAFAHSAAQ